MNAQDFRNISLEITNAEKLEVVYNDILVPMLKRSAENKRQYLEIRDNQHRNDIRVKLKELGFNKNLQSLVETEMKPFLNQKGFKLVTYSPSYLVKITW